MKFVIYVGALLLSPFIVDAQTLLQSGPMVGYCEMREVMLWVQTNSEAKVRFEYYDSSAPVRRYSTNTIQTEKLTGFTAHCLADSVQPGNAYFYELFINEQKVERPYPMHFKTPPLWQWRSDPPAFRIAIGSCLYINEERYDRPGRPYGGDYQILSRITEKKPEVMLWLGDNVYLREADWNTRTGIFHRYTHTRSLDKLQPLLAASANYAIWDDHDFGPNDCDRGFWNRSLTLEAFKAFWANPSYGIGKPAEGIATMFSWGDCDFFLLDDRWFRSPDKRKTGERTILGSAQFEWLIDNLASSTATFKVVCIGGQVLNSEALFENYATYAAERERLLDAIVAEGISGVLFLSGDRHHTELSSLRTSTGSLIYDLTSSPLSSGSNTRANTESNKNRVEGTYVGERNFSTIDFIGKREDRTMLVTTFNAEGKELWQRKISAKEMRAH